MSVRRKDKISKRNTKVLMIIIVALIAVYAVNIYVTMGLNNYLSAKLFASAEATRPANIKLVELVDKSCDKCFNILNLASVIRQSSIVKVTDEKVVDYTSFEGKSLIGKYNIQKVPALIATGEIDKSDIASAWTQLGGVKTGDAIVMDYLPYLNLSTKKIDGVVSLINIINTNCPQCYNVSVHKSVLAGSFNVYLDDEVTYDLNSNEAKELIVKYNIFNIPTIIISPEMGKYPDFQSVWSEVGSTENDGSFVFRNTDFMKQQGGYFDLINNSFIK